MTRQIVRFAYVQNVKVAAILYFIISFIYVPIGIVTVFLATDEEQRFGGIGLIAAPLIAPIAVAIFLPIIIAVYNGLAKVIGGIEYVSEEKDVPGFESGPRPEA
jgi:hypothetical protein